MTAETKRKVTDDTILDCGHKPSKHSDFTTGYGTDAQGKTNCYECCARNDLAQMRATGKAVLYLTHDLCGYQVSNWPGSLKLQPHGVRTGKHNIARTRTDVWFKFEGTTWYGVQYGRNTQLCHCKRMA